jgi:hypothetical protein
LDFLHKLIQLLLAQPQAAVQQMETAPLAAPATRHNLEQLQLTAEVVVLVVQAPAHLSFTGHKPVAVVVEDMDITANQYQLILPPDHQPDQLEVL